MTNVPFPKLWPNGQGSVAFDQMAIWLGHHIGQDFEMGIARWSIISSGTPLAPCIRFREDNDAVMFALKWT